MIGLFTRNDRAAGRHAYQYSMEMEYVVGLYDYEPRHRRVTLGEALGEFLSSQEVSR